MKVEGILVRFASGVIGRQKIAGVIEPKNFATKLENNA
jgi:hypothetical protein